MSPRESQSLQTPNQFGSGLVSSADGLEPAAFAVHNGKRFGTLGNPGAETAELVVENRGLPRRAAVEFLDGNAGQSGLSLPNLVSMSEFAKSCVYE